MKALRLTNYGSVRQNVHLAEAPKPLVQANDVLIEVRAASINPIDYKIIHGDLKRIQRLQFPAALGFDVSGVIVRIGHAVTQFQVGDQVYARATRQRMGTFAEYAALDSGIVARKPTSLSYSEAAALPLVALTTVQALRDRAEAQPGQHVLIHAGSGGVGTFAIQYAKLLGLEVSTTASSRNADWLRALGADHVICYDNEDYRQAGKRYDIVFDTLGGQYTSDAFRVLQPGGVVVSIAGVPDADFGAQVDASLPLRLLFWAMNRRIYRTAQRHHAEYYRFLTDSDGAQLVEIAAQVDAGKLKPVIDKVYPFSASIEALEYAEAGHTKGKVIIELPEQPDF